MVLSRKIDDRDGLVRALATDYRNADAPEITRAMFRFIEKFVTRSWEMSPADLEAARASGAADEDVVDWAQLGALQTFFLVQADGAGVFFPDEAAIAVGRSRESYAETPEGMTAGARCGFAPDPAPLEAAPCLVETACDSSEFLRAASASEARWGCVPNLIRATSAGSSPSLLPRQAMMLELLERPQSSLISPLHHALVRALVSGLDRCAYSDVTIREQLRRAGGCHDDLATARRDPDLLDLEELGCTVLALADKAARHAYKITAGDVEAFHRVGLDDAAYVDVLCTVAMQLGVDRIANALGVAPDPRALLCNELPS